MAGIASLLRQLGTWHPTTALGGTGARREYKGVAPRVNCSHTLPNGNSSGHALSESSDTFFTKSVVGDIHVDESTTVRLGLDVGRLRL
jgi:hypothetical protein